MSTALPQQQLTALTPYNEPERLAALQRYNVLDTPPEAAFDRITQLAARLFKVPTALISLVDESRAWFKSCVGFGASQAPRDNTLCSFAVLTNEPLIVPDARLDDRFACNPFVQAEPGVRFYAGAPLLSQDGFNLGTLCLLDSQPRSPLTAEQQATLVDLAAMVVDELELRLATQNVAQSEEKYRTLFESIDEGFCICEMLFDKQGEPNDYRFLEVNSAFERLTGLEQATGKRMRELAPNHEAYWFETYGRVVQTREPVRFENYASALNRWFNVNAFCVGEPQNNQFAVLFTNITEAKRIEADRKQAEIALQQTSDELEGQLRKFDATLSTIADCVFSFDREGRFLYANQVLLDLWGVTAPEAIGKTMADLNYPPTVEQQVLDDLQRVIETGEIVRNETPYTNPAGFEGYFEYSLSPVIAADRTVESVVGLSCDISDRKRAEATLRESETRLRFMLDASQIGDWDLDLTTEPHTAHRSLRHDQIFGYKSLLPEWSYEVFLAHVHPDDRAAVDEKFQETLSASTNWNFECRVIHPDQSIHWIWVRSSIYCDSSDTPTRLLGMVVDITERKQIEAALQASEKQSRNILESITDAFFALDENWQFTYVNQTAYTLTGYEPGALIGKNFWESFPGLPDSEFERMHRHVMRDRVADSLTAFYPDHDRWYEVRTYPATNGITIYFRNVTEQIKAEEAVRQSESHLRLMIESAKDYAIFTLDLNGIVTKWNAGAERLLQYSEAEIIGRDGRIIFTPEDRKQGSAERELQIALTQGRAENERWHLRKDSSRFWGSGLVMPLQDEAGNTQGFVKIMQDKTTQRQAEAEREQLLQREQAARETAERANQIKDEFLAVLSHELRSPLNPILGWTQLLQKGKLDEARQREALATIERNAKLQTQLIEDLLDISRIMQGKLSLTVTPVSLTSVITAAVETVRLAAEAKNIQILLDLTPESISVSGDAARLQQVVWNLLTNAVKFTPRGGQVTIELRQLDRLAQIRVTDTGKGINPQFLPHVFEYFRQADATTTRNFGGLGLGLAIVQQIMEMHGGTVWAESEGENRGAIFTVQLPVNLQEQFSEPELPHDNLITEAPLSNLQILLVDDETDAREFQTFLLEQSGAKVTAVASGFEALQSLDRSIPDVLISDVGMAEMDGYMLIQQIRSRPHDRGGMIPAIALTAYARDFDQQKAIQSGFQTHIKKPVDPALLVGEIAKLLKPN